MRRGHSGKRKLRRMQRGKRSRKSSGYKKARIGKKAKHLLNFIDHTSKKTRMAFAGSIAKATTRWKYDSCVCVTTGACNAADPPALQGPLMQPWATVFEYASLSSTRTPFLIPLQLLNGGVQGQVDPEFQRHATMYTQYRIKCIRFEYTPWTAVTGSKSMLPINAQSAAIGTGDRVADIMGYNTAAASHVWLVKWPNKKTGEFGDFGTNFNNPTNTNVFTSSALVDPTVIKIPCSEKMVLTWKPKVLGYRPVLFRTLNTLLSTSTSSTEANLPVAKKFPWTNIVDNFESTTKGPLEQVVGDIPVSGVFGNTGPYNTAGMRMPLTQPLLACFDIANNQVINGSAFLNYGRFTVHTVFEFRNKRDRAAAGLDNIIENDVDNTGGQNLQQQIEVN